jgi:hypothetical protein
MPSNVRVRVMLTSVALAFLFTLGCGREAALKARLKKNDDLKQIGLFYSYYLQTHKDKAPASAEELAKYAAEYPEPPAGQMDQFVKAKQVVESVKSGQYVIIWGSTPQEMGKIGVSVTILGYEKDAPNAGGVVLMGDGLTRTMTLAEFQSTPKASGK